METEAKRRNEDGRPDDLARRLAREIREQRAELATAERRLAALDAERQVVAAEIDRRHSHLVLIEDALAALGQHAALPDPHPQPVTPDDGTLAALVTGYLGRRQAALPDEGDNLTKVETILQMLKSAYPSGLAVADIHAVAELGGIDLRKATISVSLNRLKEAGMVRLAGGRWHYLANVGGAPEPAANDVVGAAG